RYNSFSRGLHWRRSSRSPTRPISSRHSYISCRNTIPLAPLRLVPNPPSHWTTRSRHRPSAKWCLQSTKSFGLHSLLNGLGR
ncbi:hypothetical protein BGZ89_008039, partial [Linnemannia elongata]